MMKDQDFPISIEVQLLGGMANGKPRSTANLCTPGTNVVMNGALHTAHCTNSTSKTYEGDQWVRVEVLAHGDEIIKHVVDGQTVLEYSKPQIGGGAASPTDPTVKVDGTPLTGGYISLQAETAPIDFRKVELLNLEGCTDAKATNYKTYHVKSNPAKCKDQRPSSGRFQHLSDQNWLVLQSSLKVRPERATVSNPCDGGAPPCTCSSSPSRLRH